MKWRQVAQVTGLGCGVVFGIGGSVVVQPRTAVLCVGLGVGFCVHIVAGVG